MYSFHHEVTTNLIRDRFQRHMRLGEPFTGGWLAYIIHIHEDSLKSDNDSDSGFVATKCLILITVASGTDFREHYENIFLSRL
jgi:hypothetical protein